MNTNVIAISGNLTKDPELRYTQENKPVTNFTIAVNGYNNRVDFLRITTFGTIAETCHKYLAKGRKVIVIGSLQVDNVEKDGDKRTYVSVVANQVEFLSNNESHEPTAPEKAVEVEDNLPF